MKMLKRIFLSGFILLSAFIWVQGQSVNRELAYETLTNRNNEQNKITLEQALSLIEKKYNVSLLYSNNLVKNKKVVQNGSSGTFKAELTKILHPFNLSFSKLNKHSYVIISTIFKSNSLKRTALQDLVSGIITDANTGNTIPGANILVKGTTTGTSSDNKGNFELTVPSLQDTLVVSFVGYQTQQVPINGRKNINIKMQTQAISGEEMVVIGYGKQERNDITGSISSVGSDKISSVPVSGVQEALQGRAAGVNVTPSTGQPGAPQDINIRGISTFGNSNPLFVIDGVPVFTDNEGTTNPLATLNPNNVESVEILKDASAAAIYGARAANGVIIITTKKGQAGETQLSINASGGVSSVPKSEFIDMMNSEQYIDYATDAYQNAGKPLPTAFQSPYLSENLSRNTSWQDAAFDPAAVQNYSISISGGNDNATYSFNTGYYDQQGTMPNSDFKRYSARINSNFNIGEKLTIKESVELSRGNWTGNFGPTSDLMQELLQSSPTMPVHNSENRGGFAGPKPKYAPINRANRVGELYLIDNATTHNRLLGSVNAEYKFLPSLSYHLNVGGDIAFNQSKTFTPTYEMGSRSNIEATLNEGRFSDNTYLIENTLTYQHTFNNVHDVTLLAGFTRQKSMSRNINGGIQDFPSNDVRTIAAGFGQTNLNGDETAWALQSEIGRLNYSYNDTYNLMVSVRRDGSSRFGKNNRYGIFPSVSGSWLITNEPFMENISALSSLKLRASWGQVGSQNIDNFASIATIQPFARYIFGDDQELVPGATFLQPGNPNLKWETTTQTDIGLDMGFLDERLSFTVDYYLKKTNNILLQVPIPSTSGIRRNNGAFQNAGSIQNEGLELAAEYQNSFGEFNYTLSGNFSTNKNEVTSLGNNDQPIFVDLTSGELAEVTTITRPGQEIGAFYGYVAQGTFKDQADLNNHATQDGAAPGDIKFKDLNNDDVINAEDRTIIGSPFPDFTYGFNINLGYQNFDMLIFLQGKQGNDLYNLLWGGINSGQGDNNATTAMLDRWTPDNRNSDVPRAILGDPNQNIRSSTRFIENGSYLRIQNIQLGYSFNSDLINRANISRMRIYVSAKNLFTFTGYQSYNPEVGTLTGGNQSGLARGIDFGVYPIPRTIEAGIQLNFN